MNSRHFKSKLLNCRLLPSQTSQWTRTLPGPNWLTQEEIDAEQRELDASIARTEWWLRIALGLFAIGIIASLYDAVKGYLP